MCMAVVRCIVWTERELDAHWTRSVVLGIFHNRHTHTHTLAPALAKHSTLEGEIAREAESAFKKKKKKEREGGNYTTEKRSVCHLLLLHTTTLRAYTICIRTDLHWEFALAVWAQSSGNRLLLTHLTNSRMIHFVPFSGSLHWQSYSYLIDPFQINFQLHSVKSGIFFVLRWDLNDEAKSECAFPFSHISSIWKKKKEKKVRKKK